MTNHKKLIDVTGPELPLFHKRKGKLKIDQSAKMPWLSTGIAMSYSWVPGIHPRQNSNMLFVNSNFQTFNWALSACVGLWARRVGL